MTDAGFLLDLSGTIAANNQDQSGASDFSGDATVSESLIESYSGNLTLTGSLITGVDPQLGPLTDNGGPTETHALLTGSPAIDAGGITSSLVNDQRGAGFPRVVGSAVDIGAFEVQPMAPGDFDDNGLFECSDINLLTDAVANGSMVADFELNGDGYVSFDDVAEWLVLAGAATLPSGNSFQFGDANLDGSVDVSDFNIWNENQFTNQTAWCLGNFNSDLVVDASDFNIWNENRFQSAAPPAVLTDVAFSHDVADEDAKRTQRPAVAWML